MLKLLIDVINIIIKKIRNTYRSTVRWHGNLAINWLKKEMFVLSNAYEIKFRIT